MPRVPRLLLIEPAGARREVVISRSPFRIGRQAGNDLALGDNRISRQHAQILAQDGGYVLEDLGSRHGTFVNGEKVLRQELHAKDNIDFGLADSFRLIFLGAEATLEELLERVETPAPTYSGSRELYHLGVLLEVARTLGTRLSLEDVLTAVVDAAIQVTRTERGVLLLTDPSGELQASVARDAKQATLDVGLVQISSSVLRRVSQTRREIIVSDAGEEPAMSAQESVARLQLHTIIAVPLEKLPVIESVDATISARQGELLGVLYLDSRAPLTAFSELDREVVRTLAREAATVIENARLFAAARAKARMDHELEIASQIQQRLLPKIFPDLPQMAVTGSTVACHAVGGDCFDVLELDGGRYGFFVGDVSGKGISAALLAALLQGVFFTTASLDIPLAEVVSRVNQYLCERSSEERYATLFYGVLDPAGRLEYVNAGHVAPIVRRKDGSVEALGSENLPVGMFRDAEYVTSTVLLLSGDFLVIYSDGISEATNRENQMFEEGRLQRVLTDFAGRGVGQLSQTIQTSVRTFTEGAPQADDMTLLVVQYRGKVN